MNSITGLANLQPADLDAGHVFSGKPSGTTVRGYATPSTYTPAIDHDYILHESSRDVVVWFLKPRGHIHRPECPRLFSARASRPRMAANQKP